MSASPPGWPSRWPRSSGDRRPSPSSRFGVVDEGIGICHTRTGRRFFNDPALESAFLDRLREACGAVGLWAELATDRVCLDAELMPWSAKAQERLRSQYAPVGAAGGAALAEAQAVIDLALAAGRDLGALAGQVRERGAAVARYVEAYSHYCWEVGSLDDLRLAPFHLLASEGRVHTDKDHLWHMRLARRLAELGGPLLQATRIEVVDLTDPQGPQRGTS